MGHGRGWTTGAAVFAGLATCFALGVSFGELAEDAHRMSPVSLDSVELRLEQTIALQRRNQGRVAGDLLRDLGSLRHARGDLAGAEDLYREALQSREEDFGPDDLAVAASCRDLGRVLQDRGDYDEARHWLDRALEIRRARLSPRDLDLADSASDLGDLELLLGHVASALALFEEAGSIYVERLGAEHASSAWALARRGACLLRLRRFEEAGAVLVLAHHRLTRGLGVEDARVTLVAAWLGEWYEVQGRSDEAAQLQGWRRW